MSRTVAVDVVGPEYWSYMAVVMAEQLDGVARSRRTIPENLPRGVYADATRFFRLVLQEVGVQPPKNPPASINAYVIAAAAAKGSGIPMGPQGQLNQRLEEYGRLLQCLDQPRDLSENEAATAASLQQFFLRLHEAGETDAYERRITFESPDALLAGSL